MHKTVPLISPTPRQTTPSHPYRLDRLQEGRIVQLDEVSPHKRLAKFRLTRPHLGITDGQGKVVARAALDVALQKVVGKESHLGHSSQSACPGVAKAVRESALANGSHGQAFLYESLMAIIYHCPAVLVAFSKQS